MCWRFFRSSNQRDATNCASRNAPRHDTLHFSQAQTSTLRGSHSQDCGRTGRRTHLLTSKPHLSAALHAPFPNLQSPTRMTVQHSNSGSILWWGQAIDALPEMLFGDKFGGRFTTCNINTSCCRSTCNSTAQHNHTRGLGAFHRPNVQGAGGAGMTDTPPLMEASAAFKLEPNTRAKVEQAHSCCSYRDS